MQLSFLDNPVPAIPEIRRKRSGGFVDNMKLPIHRWFRYSAGFSADWVESVVRKEADGRVLHVLDPFCGSGTTLIASAKCGANSVGFETHPFISRIARIKTSWKEDLGQLDSSVARMIRFARESEGGTIKNTSRLLARCYSAENLRLLEAFREACIAERERGCADHILDLVWLGLTCILRECSRAGTAQWQYLLPNKNKARVKCPIAAFQAKMDIIKQDLLYAKATCTGSAKVIQTDARNPDCSELFDLVITSPPYPNNYDYADATRLELMFWEEIGSWGDLQKAVRQYLIRSCSQHSAAEKLSLPELLESEVVAPIRDELSTVCERLGEIRKSKGGRKTYHTMVAAYFVDLAKVWNSLRNLTGTGAKVAFVIGDSAPYGVYVPCDDWLGKLALSAGFAGWRFDKLRDRNIKWKNRKHRVPLKEGILWVEA